LEESDKEVLTYKNNLKYLDYAGFNKLTIKDSKKRNILDNHVYYLKVTKEGTVLHTFRICINDKTVHLQ
ncbi:hypothetical protein NQ810_19255, partial [Acinetobacter baumannii]|nr:hypothetical protein [Acinetobacter baumannii]